MDAKANDNTVPTTNNINLNDLSAMIRKIIKEEHENLKTELNNSIAAYTKPFFEIYDKNFESFKLCMESVGQNATEALSTANQNKKDIQKLEQSVENIMNKPITPSSPTSVVPTTDPTTISRIDALEKRLAETEDELDDLRNRSMRGNLVIHGLREEENDKLTTKDLIANFLHIELGAPTPDAARKQLVRAHRGRKSNSERNTPRPIYVKFSRDDLAEEYLKVSIQKRLTDRGMKVTKQFTKKLQARINVALQRRRQLVESGDIMKGFVEYPAVLKGKTRDDQGYRTIEVF